MPAAPALAQLPAPWGGLEGPVPTTAPATCPACFAEGAAGRAQGSCLGAGGGQEGAGDGRDGDSTRWWGHGHLTGPFACAAAAKEAPAAPGEMGTSPRANSSVSGHGAVAEPWAGAVGVLSSKRLLLADTWWLRPLPQPALQSLCPLPGAQNTSGQLGSPAAAPHRSEQLPGCAACPPSRGRDGGAGSVQRWGAGGAWCQPQHGLGSALAPCWPGRGSSRWPRSLLAAQKPVVPGAAGRRRRETMQSRRCCKSWWPRGW